MKKRYLYLTVFFAGMSALAVEMSASRLIGNVYGSSNLVWASVIGLILIYLSMGYWLGGRLADKYPTMRTFYTILIWSSFSIALVPMMSRPVLRFTANAFDRLQVGILAGSFIAILLLFIIPVILLGMITPFALKLSLVNTESAGRTAGFLSAISTLGSFIGTFLPVLVLIPLIGTYRTFLFFSSVLMLISILGLLIFVDLKSCLRLSWMPIVLILLWIFGVRGADKATDNLVFETESSYNYIQVVELNDYRYLRLNEGQGVHSVYHPTDLYYYGPWSQVLVAPFFNSAPHKMDSVEKIAIIGLAAGTTARQASAVYEDVLITGFEIDPKIVQVGQSYFEMNQPNLEIIVEDGRWGLNHSDKFFDIISIDAYRPPYIPWHMTTLEYFEIVNQKLTEDGVMVINIGRSPVNRTLVNDLATTIRQVFPTIFVMDVPDSFNSILFATKKPGSWDNFLQNYILLSEENAPFLLLQTMSTTIIHQQTTPEMTRVYTDDRTPIEWVTNKIVIDFLLTDGKSDIQ